MQKEQQDLCVILRMLGNIATCTANGVSVEKKTVKVEAVQVAFWRL